MAQSASTASLLRSAAPAASKCGDVNAYACLKIVNPYDCSASESFVLSTVGALALAGQTVKIYVSGTPLGATAPTVLDPFYLYAGTTLTFGATELKVIETAQLTSTNTGVDVKIEPAAGIVVAASTTNLYRFHVIEGIANIDENSQDESTDTTKNKDGIQKSDDVTSRGLQMTFEAFLNTLDRGIWAAAHELLNNGGEKGLVSLYGLPGLLTVGQASFMNGSIKRQAKSKAKMSADLMFSAPFKRFNLVDYQDPATLAIHSELAKLWGYSVTDFS